MRVACVLGRCYCRSLSVCWGPAIAVVCRPGRWRALGLGCAAATRPSVSGPITAGSPSPTGSPPMTTFPPSSSVEQVAIGALRGQESHLRPRLMCGRVVAPPPRRGECGTGLRTGASAAQPRSRAGPGPGQPLQWGGDRRARLCAAASVRGREPGVELARRRPPLPAPITLPPICLAPHCLAPPRFPFPRVDSPSLASIPLAPRGFPCPPPFPRPGARHPAGLHLGRICGCLPPLPSQRSLVRLLGSGRIHAHACASSAQTPAG